MWTLREETRQPPPGRILAVSVPDAVRKLLVWTERGFYAVVFLKTARTRRLPTVRPEHFHVDTGFLRAENHDFRLYGRPEVGGPVYTPATLTEHPAGDRVEPDPEANVLRVIGPNGTVRQVIPNFHCGREPWAMAAFTPDGRTLVVADPQSVRLFQFTPDAGHEPGRWQASGNKNERDALVRGIIENADDNTPRLVYADWLQENGDADRAEFVRLQVRRGSRWDWNDAAFVADYNLEQNLLNRYGERWRAEFPKVRGVQWAGFHRGFPQLSVRTGTTFAARAAEVWAASPVEELSIEVFEEASARGLVSSPFLERLRAIRLAGDGGREAGLRVLFASPRVRGLRRLSLTMYSPTSRDPDVRLLIASPNLASLESLSLGYGSPITEGVALALARAPSLRNLKQVHLNTYQYGPAAVAELKARFTGVT